MYAGRTAPGCLMDTFRRAVLLCPTEDREPLAVDDRGITWLLAFTTPAALARWAVARGDGAAPWEFARIDGARLLDVAAPEAGSPCGVAVDVGSDRPLLLPPVRGIVPDRVAVDEKNGAIAARRRVGL
ncbi:SseB family protein [Streptacidiphilus sp. NEAU-YB345]|uniref:SseB family protein n=2 Tax=Streptacidiphilus fuscans TaxID=2789292 RepID=A0A931FG30_9ACTN|nr:SseB family protein [Streptacidiphilus fuscans]